MKKLAILTSVLALVACGGGSGGSGGGYTGDPTPDTPIVDTDTPNTGDNTGGENNNGNDTNNPGSDSGNEDDTTNPDLPEIDGFLPVENVTFGGGLSIQTNAKGQIVALAETWETPEGETNSVTYHIVPEAGKISSVEYPASPFTSFISRNSLYSSMSNGARESFALSSAESSTTSS